MFTLAGYYQSVQNAAGGTKINAINDGTLTVSGVDIRVPKDLPYLMGAKASCNDATFTQSELQSPSLRKVFNIDIEPIDAAGVIVPNYAENLWPYGPLQLDPNENLELLNMAAPAGAVDNYGFVWLADGPQQPVKGPFYTVRATAVTGAAAAKGVWNNQPLAFAQTIPAGDYQVCGMRARGANLIAARLFFVGGAWRPGVIGDSLIGHTQTQPIRFGQYGVLGQFNNTTPPTVEIVDGTNETVTILLDLIKVH